MFRGTFAEFFTKNFMAVSALIGAAASCEYGNRPRRFQVRIHGSTFLLVIEIKLEIDSVPCRKGNAIQILNQIGETKEFFLTIKLISESLDFGIFFSGGYTFKQAEKSLLTLSDNRIIYCVIIDRGAPITSTYLHKSL